MAENRCRICMVSKSHQVYLFNAGFDLPSKIMEVADVLVKEGDGLPATVCVDCEADLVKCHQFRTQVRVADQQFRAGLTRQEFPLKQEPEHIIEDTNDGDLNKTEDHNLDKIEDEAVTTEPLSHVDVIETSQKTEISDDPFGQEEPLIEAENKLDNEPPLDPLTYVKVEPGLMEIDDSAGPSTSSMVRRTGCANRSPESESVNSSLQSYHCAKSGTRKHVTLTLSKKFEILKRLEEGAKLSLLSKEYNVGRSTVHNIRQNKDKIELFFQKNGFSSSSKRKTLRSGDFPQVEDALYEWFVQEKHRHSLVSGEILKEKARYFYSKLMKDECFCASDGWLDNFKRRFGIRLTDKKH